MDKEYRRNHYIPEYYLRNFTNSRNHFFVFDKKAKWNKILYKSPSSICFEWDRNTFFFNDGTIYKGLEKETYGYFDNEHSATFRLLDESGFDEFPWNLKTVGDLELFVPLTYWRSPISDAKFKKSISKSDFIDQTKLVMQNSEGKAVDWTDDFRKKFLSDKNIGKSLRPIIAFSSFGKPHKMNDELEWRIIYRNDDKTNLTSDNPIIFGEEPKSFEDFRGSVIFPATRNKSLIRINEETSFQFCHEAFLQQIQICHQAERYVISSDKDYLLEIVNEWKVFKKLGIIGSVKSWLFEKYKAISHKVQQEIAN